MANLMLCLMDGRRTMREIWEAVGRKAGDDPPTQDETIELLAQLHGADLLQGEIPPDFDEMVARSEKASRRRMMQQLRNPMAVRVPLFDPDRLLDLTMPFLRPLFTVPGFLAWLALVATGVVLAVIHWPELTSDVSDRALATRERRGDPLRLPLHQEPARARTRVRDEGWGGEVHEIGVMLLVFVPVLYVDASASAAFSQKRRRIIVGAAGILVEMALAAVATIVWLHGSPGLGRTVAFNVMLIGGVSTLLFNGNPLLRFDGYYIFSDLIEIPNLGSAQTPMSSIFFRGACSILTTSRLPSLCRAKRKWLLSYAVLAFAYRMPVWVGIALFLTTRLVFVGLLMVVWAVGMIAVVPVFKGVKFLATSPRLRGQRRRAFAVVGGLAAAAVTILFLIPLPYATVAEGVIDRSRSGGGAGEDRRLRNQSRGDAGRLRRGASDVDRPRGSHSRGQSRGHRSATR